MKVSGIWSRMAVTQRSGVGVAVERGQEANTDAIQPVPRTAGFLPRSPVGQTQPSAPGVGSGGGVREALAEEMQIQVLERVIERLTGRRLRFVRVEDLDLDAETRRVVGEIRARAEAVRAMAVPRDEDALEHGVESSRSLDASVAFADAPDQAVLVRIGVSGEIAALGPGRVAVGRAFKDAVLIDNAARAPGIEALAASVRLDLEGALEGVDQRSPVRAGGERLELDLGGVDPRLARLQVWRETAPERYELMASVIGGLGAVVFSSDRPWANRGVAARGRVARGWESPEPWGPRQLDLAV